MLFKYNLKWFLIPFLCLTIKFKNSFGNSFPKYMRIVGGENVNITELPYHVAIMLNGEYICGGSVLTSDIVLTAAHCTYNRTTNEFTVRGGSSKFFEGGELRSIRSISQHPSFSIETFENDIAILHLGEPFGLSNEEKSTKRIQFVRIYNGDPPVGETGIVSGWGATKQGGYASLYLQKVRVNIISKSFCKLIYGKHFTENMFCAGYKFGAKDACQGDSGGPLTYNGELIGIVSWGYGCAQPFFPGVYTNVYRYNNWIKEIIAIN